MKIIVPKTLTDADILSSNITEDDAAAYDATVVYLQKANVVSGHTIYKAVVGDSIDGISAWDEATAYVAGNKRYVEATHAIYQCNKDSTGQYPPNYLSGDSPVWTQVGYLNRGVDLSDTNYWLEIGPTNYYAMFDAYTSTQSAGVLTDGEYVLERTINASKCNAIALFNCSGRYVDLSLTTSAGKTVWSSRVNLSEKVSHSWSDYFFVSPTVRPSVYEQFPIYYGTKLTVKIVGTSQALCGALEIGMLKSVGASLWGAEWSIVDYSKKETNTSGITYLSKGKYHDKLTLSVFINTSKVDEVKSFLSQYRATGIAWICDNSDTVEGLMQTMFVFGFYNNLSIVLKGLVESDCSLEIESLI